jgi:hypothetical protein
MWKVGTSFRLLRSDSAHPVHPTRARRRANAKVRAYQARVRELTADKGLKCEPPREQIGSARWSAWLRVAPEIGARDVCPGCGAIRGVDDGLRSIGGHPPNAQDSTATRRVPAVLVHNDTWHLPPELRWTGFPPEFHV